MTFRDPFAIALGGLLLIWPALANGYPLLFVDTGAFLDQALRPFMLWDKPWVYGPALVAVSLKWSLWPAALAQGWLVSWTIWRVGLVFWPPMPAAHVAICFVLALGSAAPWFAALTMPDIFAPLTVLSLFVLAFAPDGRRWPVVVLASFAIAAHLAHLAVALACVALVVLLKPRAAARTALPLVLAASVLMATNVIGHGRFGLSPFGSVFALARLTADGPARTWLEQVCPDPDLAMCAWIGRLPADSDIFLWSPDGPVWTHPGGPIALAPEASRIVAATLRSQPWPVARDALRNTVAQFFWVRLGVTTGARFLDEAIGTRLRTWYPPEELERFMSSRQRDGRMGDPYGRLRDAHTIGLVAGAFAMLVLGARAWRRDPVFFALVASIAAGLAANAFATGALSGPADRYQSRIVWLVLLPPSLAVARKTWHLLNARSDGKNNREAAKCAAEPSLPARRWPPEA